jgi:hypothetical protein
MAQGRHSQAFGVRSCPARSRPKIAADSGRIVGCGGEVERWKAPRLQIRLQGFAWLPLVTTTPINRPR